VTPPTRTSAVGYVHMRIPIPRNLADGIERYLTRGIAPGDFLSAVIRNDLRATFALGDPASLSVLPAVLAFLYWEAPGRSSGSPAIMDTWVAHRGEEGMP
jgi:hypothetical protein